MKPYVIASTIAAVVLPVASTVFWYVLGATYADGQIIVDDPTVRIETGINGNRYAAYESIYFIDVASFIVLHTILLVVLLFVVNLIVWFVILLKRPPQTG